jgi:transglutaminase-like putative cysteine protease
MSLKAWCVGALLWLCVATTGVAQDRPAMAASPDWVIEEGASASEESSGGRDDLRYDVVSDQIDLTGNRPVWHRHIRYRVLRERGLSDAGNISIGYQPDYQALVLNRLDVVRDGQRLDLRARAHYARLRREQDLDQGLLDGEVTLSITVPDLRVGDQLDYSFSLTGDNPIFGNAYYDTYAARYGVPLGFRRVRVRYPASRPVWSKVSTSGFEVRRASAAGIATLDITASQLPAVREPNDTPEGHDSFGRISLSTARDWRAVVDWAAPLYPRTFVDRAVADALSRQLSLDPAQPEAAFMRAVAFVQGQIRYTGLDMGANSHQPHAPEETLRNRYGDCKDKATLLVALLGLAGIHAEPVLVNTRPGYDLRAALPAATVFDHVVVRAHLPTGDVWVDATRDREDGPLAQRRVLPFKAGLPLVAGNAGLVEVPYPIPSMPQVQVDERIDVRDTGAAYAATFNVLTTYRQGQGDEVRDAFRQDGAEEKGRQYLRYMRDFYKGMRAKAAPVVEDRPESEVLTRESYSLGWDKADSKVLEIWLFQLNDWMKGIPSEARITPFALTGPRTARQTIAVHLEGPIVIPDRRQEVANRWFRFVRSEHVQGQVLTVTGEWTRLDTQIPASGVEQASLDMETARDLLVFSLDMDSRVSLFDAGWRDWRWPLAGLLLTVLLLLACLPFRRGGTPLAMVFGPKAGAVAIQGRHWMLAIAWVAYFAVTYINLLGDHLSPASKVPVLMLALGLLVGAIIGGWLHLALSAALLRLSLHLLKYRAATCDRLLAALVAAAFPLVPFMLGVLVALEGHVSRLHEEFQASSVFLPGIVVAGGLVLIGYGWSVVASISAVAGVAGITRKRALAAIALLLAAVLVLIGVAAGIVRLAR